MPGEHVLVATVLGGVGARAPHHLAPPVGDVLSMLHAHRAAEDRTKQVVFLDQVVERLEPSPEHRAAADPLEDRRHGVRVHALFGHTLRLRTLISSQARSRLRSRRLHLMPPHREDGAVTSYISHTTIDCHNAYEL